MLRSRSFTIESRYIHFLAAGTGRADQRRHRRVREDSLADLRRADDVDQHRPRLRWVTTGRRDVGRAIPPISRSPTARWSTLAARPRRSTTATAGSPSTRSARPISLRRPQRPAQPADRPSRPAVDLTAAIAALRATRPAGRAAGGRSCRSRNARSPDPRPDARAVSSRWHGHERARPHPGQSQESGRARPPALPDGPGRLGLVGSRRRKRPARAGAPDGRSRRSIRSCPRVLVNRLWKHHFGEGIVRSTDDFGAMGQKPSHPELLDWLAAKLVESGWSIKAMHRLMVTSSTYRMSSVPERRRGAESTRPTRSCIG